MSRRFRVVIPAECEVVVDLYALDPDHALDIIDGMNLHEVTDDLSREADLASPGLTISADGLRLDKAEALPARAVPGCALTVYCTATFEARFEGHQPQHITCTRPEGHTGQHRALIYDTDDNLILYHWWTNEGKNQ